MEPEGARLLIILTYTLLTYVNNNYRQPAMMIVRFSGCLFSFIDNCV